jgi:release factor glutamine methyltransferase
MTSVYEHIAGARQTLVDAGLRPADAAIDAEVLARHALGWDRARLLADGRDRAPVEFARHYVQLVARRARWEPVAFITGHREFWGLDFEVTPDVLIPRPETELIVQAVCARTLDRTSPLQILDVGTGSGCLAVALASEFPGAMVTATDISAAALEVARRNARRHGVADRVRFVRGNLLEPIAGPVGIIVSNPPYVPSNVELSRDIVRFEPAVALFSGVEGLTALERLIASARARIARGGFLVVEFGLGQDDRIAELAAAAGWGDVTIDGDLQGIPRIAVMTRE